MDGMVRAGHVDERILPEPLGDALSELWSRRAIAGFQGRIDPEHVAI
jgi:hypothetical protein